MKHLGVGRKVLLSPCRAVLWWCTCPPPAANPKPHFKRSGLQATAAPSQLGFIMARGAGVDPVLLALVAFWMLLSASGQVQVRWGCARGRNQPILGRNARAGSDEAAGKMLVSCLPPCGICSAGSGSCGTGRCSRAAFLSQRPPAAVAGRHSACQQQRCPNSGHSPSGGRHPAGPHSASSASDGVAKLERRRRPQQRHCTFQRPPNASRRARTSTRSRAHSLLSIGACCTSRSRGPADIGARNPHSACRRTRPGGRSAAAAGTTWGSPCARAGAAAKPDRSAGSSTSARAGPAAGTGAGADRSPCGSAGARAGAGGKHRNTCISAGAGACSCCPYSLSGSSCHPSGSCPTPGPISSTSTSATTAAQPAAITQPTSLT